MDRNMIITIGNNQKFAIADSVEYSGEKYYYIIEVDSEKEELKSDCRIIRVINDNNYARVQMVTDKESLSKIIPLFASHYL